MRVSRIYYLVLMVRDMEATCSFCSRLLRVAVEEFEGRCLTLKFGWQKINLIRAAKTSSSKPTGSHLDLTTSACQWTFPLESHKPRPVVVVRRRDFGRISHANRGATGRIESVYC